MTNGFDLTKVITALAGRIGWKQPLASGSPVITDANKTSRSGRYYQDFHSLVSVEKIKATMEEAGASDANLNAHLEALSKSAILRCLSGVFREKEYIEQVMVWDRIERSIETSIENQGLFVGCEIALAPRMDYAVQIDAVKLLFDGDVTFNLYLFAEGSTTALATKEVSATGGEATVVTFDDLILNYGSTRQFYLGYFQDDLGSVKAIHEEPVFNRTLMFAACPVQSLPAGEAEFSRVEISNTNRTYGLNLEMSSFKDHTNQIVKKPGLFDEAIGLTVAYQVLEQIIYSTQSNANERVMKEAVDKVGLQLDLNGAAPISDGPKIKGLAQRIDEEMKRLRSSFYSRPKAQVVNLC